MKRLPKSLGIGPKELVACFREAFQEAFKAPEVKHMLRMFQTQEAETFHKEFQEAFKEGFQEEFQKEFRKAVGATAPTPKGMTISAEEAAEALGVSVRTLFDHRYRERIGLPMVKLGRKVHFYADDVVALLERRRTVPGEEKTL